MQLNNIVDKIYCINLKRRPDRLTLFEERFKNAFTTNVDIPSLQILEAVDARSQSQAFPAGWRGLPGAYACTLSHLKVIREAVTSNETTIMILEDDVTFDADFSNKLAIVLDELPEDWDWLYLGYNPQEPLERVSQHLATTVGLTTHAYLLNNQHNIFQTIIKELPVAKDPIDLYYVTDLQKRFNTYFSVPRLCGQDNNSYSDIQGRVCNYTSELGF